MFALIHDYSSFSLNCQCTSPDDDTRRTGHYRHKWKRLLMCIQRPMSQRVHKFPFRRSPTEWQVATILVRLANWFRFLSRTDGNCSRPISQLALIKFIAFNRKKSQLFATLSCHEIVSPTTSFAFLGDVKKSLLSISIKVASSRMISLQSNLSLHRPTLASGLATAHSISR